MNTPHSTTNSHNVSKAQAKKQEVLDRIEKKKAKTQLKKDLIKVKKEAKAHRDKKYFYKGEGNMVVAGDKSRTAYLYSQTPYDRNKRFQEVLAIYSRDNDIDHNLLNNYMQALEDKDKKEADKLLDYMLENQKINREKRIQAEKLKAQEYEILTTKFHKQIQNKPYLELIEMYKKLGEKNIFDVSDEEKLMRSVLQDTILHIPKMQDTALEQDIRSLKNRFIVLDTTDYQHNKHDYTDYFKRHNKHDYTDYFKRYEETSLYKTREQIEEYFNIKPIKEFGTNYAEYFRDGQGAITRLLIEAKDYEARKEAGKLTEAEIEQGAYKGQVAGAFYKEGLGEAEAKAKAREFVESIPHIIENGKVVKDDKGRLRIEFDNFIVGIKDNWKGKPTNKWIVTGYAKKEGGESLYASSPITKGETLPLNSKENSTTKVNENEATLAKDSDFKENQAVTRANEKTPLIFRIQGELDIKELRANLKEAIKDILNKDITNKETGMVARISRTGVNKISSQKALNKSLNNGYTKEEHYKAGEHIKELFEKGSLREKHKDYKDRAEIQAVYRFVTPITINNKQANVLITMFENNQAGNKIYSLELEGLEPISLSPSVYKAEMADISSRHLDSHTQPTATIAKSDNVDSTTKEPTTHTMNRAKVL